MSNTGVRRGRQGSIMGIVAVQVLNWHTWGLAGARKMDRQSSPSALAFCTPSTSVSSRGILLAATTAAMLPLVTPWCCLARTWVKGSLCCSTSSPCPSSLCNGQTGSKQVHVCFRQCNIVSRCSELLKAWQFIALLAGRQAADDIVVRIGGNDLHYMPV